MGVLDEAIREHLELKRRHGADPGEVARLEHEALGPARREAVPVAPGEDAVDDDPELVEEEQEAPAEPDAYLPSDEDEHVEALVEDEEPVYDEDVLGEEDEPPPAVTEADQPTVAFDVTQTEDPEQAAAAEGPEAGHDELEETPEFLQETPEHDRLWFEQKPPKDFDF
jgi:hypothetical protein